MGPKATAAGDLSHFALGVLQKFALFLTYFRDISLCLKSLQWKVPPIQGEGHNLSYYLLVLRLLVFPELTQTSSFVRDFIEQKR